MKAKDYLIITNYFPPETGAASNRIFAMAEALQKTGSNVSIVCPLPNYPVGVIFKGYRGKLISKSQESGLTVYRLWHIASNSKKKVARLLSMLSFCFSLFTFLLLKKTPKIHIIQCSPLFVGFTAVLSAKLKRKKVVLNVSDLWPLAGLQMGLLKKGWYYSILEKIEDYCYKNSDLILGQSQEILTHIKEQAPHKKLLLYRNFPEFKIPDAPVKTGGAKVTKFVYAGLLGLAQDIVALLQRLDLPENSEFHIYGNGPEAETVASFAVGNEKIFFHGSLDRTALHRELMNYDVAIIPLKNRIYGSVPSKIAEFATLGLPVVYFSEGEGATMVEQLNLGWAIKDSDYQGLNALIGRIVLKQETLPDKSVIKATAHAHFNFKAQFSELSINLSSL